MRTIFTLIECLVIRGNDTVILVVFEGYDQNYHVQCQHVLMFTKFHRTDLLSQMIQIHRHFLQIHDFDRDILTTFLWTFGDIYLGKCTLTD